MTLAKRIEFFDGQGIRQINDAFVVSMEEMETLKFFVGYYHAWNHQNKDRKLELSENWLRALDEANVANLIISGKAKKDGRLAPQYNTERQIERMIYP